LGDHTLNNKVPFNEADFEKLFKTHFKELCFFAQLYLKDLDSAKEIVQEAFISLWEKRQFVDETKSILSYLKTSVTNKSLNYLRNNKKFDRDILSFEGLYPEAGQKASDSLVVEEIKNKIDSALDELPERCKEIFLLNRYENLKYKEIADKLNISIKTVEAQMSKALQHMRIRLVHYIGILILLINLKYL
jgi:RNA polymerase sigma-70 factor (ECF subfamily)